MSCRRRGARGGGRSWPRAPSPAPTQWHPVTCCGFVCWYRTTYSAVSRLYGVLTHNATQWYPNASYFTLLTFPFDWFDSCDRFVGLHSASAASHVALDLKLWLWVCGTARTACDMNTRWLTTQNYNACPTVAPHLYMFPVVILYYLTLYLLISIYL